MRAVLVLFIIFCVCSSFSAAESRSLLSNEFNVGLYPLLFSRVTWLETRINDRDVMLVNAARGGLYLYGYNQSYRLTSYVRTGDVSQGRPFNLTRWGLSMGGSSKIGGVSLSPAMMVEGAFPFLGRYWSEVLFYSDSVSVQPTFDLWRSPGFCNFELALRYSFLWTYAYSGAFGAVGGPSICIDYIF